MSILVSFNILFAIVQKKMCLTSCMCRGLQLEVALDCAHPAGILAGIGESAGRCHRQSRRQRHKTAGPHQATGTSGQRWRGGPTRQAKVVARAVDRGWRQVGRDGHSAHVLVSSFTLGLAPPK